MATGPQHYAEAERLLDLTQKPIPDSEFGWMARAQAAAEAQVHATLALAAATALCGTDPDGSSYAGDMNAWYRTAGVKPASEEPQP